MARTVDVDVAGAFDTLERLARLGVDLAAITDKLELDGVASFSASFEEVLATLAGRAQKP